MRCPVIEPAKAGINRIGLIVNRIGNAPRRIAGDRDGRRNLFQRSQEAGAPSRNRMSGKPVRSRAPEVGLRFHRGAGISVPNARHPSCRRRTVSTAQRFSRLSAD